MDKNLFDAKIIIPESAWKDSFVWYIHDKILTVSFLHNSWECISVCLLMALCYIVYNLYFDKGVCMFDSRLTLVFIQRTVQVLLQLPLYRNHYKKAWHLSFFNCYTSEWFLNAFWQYVTSQQICLGVTFMLSCYTSTWQIEGQGTQQRNQRKYTNKLSSKIRPFPYTQVTHKIRDMAVLLIYWWQWSFVHRWFLGSVYWGCCR